MLLLCHLPLPTIPSWSSILVTLLKMIRRLFTTFVDQAIPVVDMNCMAAHNMPPASFRVTGYESLNWLHQEAPCFPVQANRITIIQQPELFYDLIASKCATAQGRIVMASLYLGTGPLEAKLVSVIGNNLSDNPNLRVNILLDFTRGTRGAVNSKTQLMPLVRQSRNVNLSLYHTPALRGLSKRLMPPRWNELIGLQHMKLYLFDDTVVISGANLSNDYFTNRQDRYIVIEDRRLADFYARLVGKVQEFSFQVMQNEECEMQARWNMSPYESDKVDFVTKARDTIFGYFAEVSEQQKFAAEEENGEFYTFFLNCI